MAIYLDHAATTPIHPEVANVFTQTLLNTFGNPSSIHQFGRDARKILDDARKKMAQSIHAMPAEIIFTSSGTEADNMAIIGVAKSRKSLGNHIITSNIEHPAVLKTCQELEKKGYNVTYLEADRNGQITVEQVENALTNQTILVTIMMGNNEVGTLQPIKEIGALVKHHQAVFHTDAVQAYGVMPIDVGQLNVDLLSVSAHKLNGPKGIGFLYVNELTALPSLIHGGEQERKRRAGTENIPAIAAFAKAITIANEALNQNAQIYRHYQKIMTETFNHEGITFTVHAEEAPRLPHIMNCSFPGVDIESFLVNLDMEGVCVSSGSACTAGSLDPSHVLTAMFGKGVSELRNSVRFSFGYGLSKEDIQKAAQTTATIVKRLTAIQ